MAGAAASSPWRSSSSPARRRAPALWAPSGTASNQAALLGAGSGAPTAYVTNSQTNTVSVITKGTSVGTILHAGNGPVGIAVAPDQKTAYVADYGFNDEVAKTVTPINLVTGGEGARHRGPAPWPSPSPPTAAGRT